MPGDIIAAKRYFASKQSCQFHFWKKSPLVASYKWCQWRFLWLTGSFCLASVISGLLAKMSVWGVCQTPQWVLFQAPNSNLNYDQSMSYDVEVQEGLGSAYGILLDAADSDKISQQDAETFFSKVDPSRGILNEYKRKTNGSYGRCEFKEGLSLWYKRKPDDFGNRADLNKNVQRILRDKDLGTYESFPLNAC